MFGRIARSLGKGTRSTTSISNAVALGMLVVIMFLGTADVIGRYFLGKPIAGTVGLTEVLLVGVVFFSAAYTLRVGGHVRLDIFVDRLGPRVQSITGVIFSFIALVMVGLIGWQGTLRALNSWEKLIVIEIVNIPLFPFELFVPAGSLILCFELIIQIVHSIDAMRKGI